MKTFQDLNLGDYFKIIRRRIWWVIVMALPVGVGASVYVWRMPSLYKSETTMVVSSRLLPEDYIGSLVRGGNQIDLVRQQLQSRSFVERIIQESSTGNGAQENIEGLVNSVLAGTQISIVSPSTFKVSYSSMSPSRAQAIAQRVAEGVIKMNETVRKERVDAADQFLNEELRRAANQLAAAENGVRQFNRQNFPSLPSDERMGLETLSNSERQLATVDTNLESLISQRKFLARRIEEQRQLMLVLQNSPAPVPPQGPAPRPVLEAPYVPTDLEKMLASKQAELRAAAARYTPLHPDVVRLTREVRDLEAQMAPQPSFPRDTTPASQTTESEPAVSLPPVDPSQDLIQAEIQLELEQLDQQIAKQQQTKKDLEGKISLLRGRLNLPPVLAQQLMNLMRDIEDAKQRYNLLAEKKVSSELAASVDTNENNALFKIIDPATFPGAPFSPNRQLFLAMGWAIALGIGLGVTFIREFTDSTFADEEDLSSQLKLPVLGSIPTVIPAKSSNQGVVGRPTLTVIAPPSETNGTPTFTLHAADSKVKHVIFNPMTIEGEQYRLIRATLSMMQKQHGLKCLLIGSTIPDEGKSFVAACLAGILAQEAGKSALLLQADIRTMNGLRLMGVHHREPIVGLSEVLQGSVRLKDALLKCAELNLYLLPSGRPVNNPADLLSKPEFENLLRDIGPRFDWIIIDSPPILALADASLMAPLSDATLMVVRAERTPAKLVRDSVERIGRDRICGFVLNRARHTKGSYYYGKYYNQILPRKAETSHTQADTTSLGR